MLFHKTIGAGGTGGSTAAPIYTGGYLQSAESTADRSSYTFSSINIGTAASDRMVLVAVHYFTNSYTVPTVNVGGSTTTRISTTFGPYECQVSTHNINVTTGTVANIVVNFSTAPFRCAISVYSFYGLSSQTPTDTSVDGGGLDIASTSLSTTSGGLVFHAGSNFGGAAGIWGSLEPSIEDENENQYYSSGFTVGTGSTMVESLDSPGTNRVSLVSATWS